MNLDVFDRKIKKIFSPRLAAFDYMGYLTRFDKRINRVGFSLGLSQQSIAKSISENIDLLVVHNSPESLRGSKYYEMINSLASRNKLSIYRVHLPLDFAHGGLIENLCLFLKLKAVPAKTNYQNCLITGGVYIAEEKLCFDDLVKRIRKLKPKTIRIAGYKRNLFKKIAITTGDGCKPEFIDQLKPDVFICGLLNQESIRIAKDLGITLIEATSHSTESVPLLPVYRNIRTLLKLNHSILLETKDTLESIEVAH